MRALQIRHGVVTFRQTIAWEKLKFDNVSRDVPRLSTGILNMKKQPMKFIRRYAVVLSSKLTRRKMITFQTSNRDIVTHLHEIGIIKETPTRRNYKQLLLDVYADAGMPKISLEHAKNEIRLYAKGKENKTAKTRKLEKEKVFAQTDEFLSSWEWTTIRMKVLLKYGRKCMCCGADPSDGVKICVDHIKPRSTHPELALIEENLQVLCYACNKGKGAWDKTDFRSV